MSEAHDRPPQEFKLKLRRYDPESGNAPYWDEHTVELEPHRSVLEGILQARDRPGDFVLNRTANLYSGPSADAKPKPSPGSITQT